MCADVPGNQIRQLAIKFQLQRNYYVRADIVSRADTDVQNAAGTQAALVVTLCANGAFLTMLSKESALCYAICDRWQSFQTSTSIVGSQFPQQVPSSPYYTDSDFDVLRCSGHAVQLWLEAS
jgi:hypothetical protein